MVCAFAVLLVAAGAVDHASRGALIPATPESARETISGSTIAAPERLIIPSLGIDVRVDGVGIDTHGDMAVPKDAAIPGWYRGGVYPGEKGNAVIAGHFDSVLGTPGVFAKLELLKPEDIVEVVDASGSILRFRVTKTASFAASASGEGIFGASDEPHLQLITCSGAWLRSANQYDKRLVVFTELVQ